MVALASAAGIASELLSSRWAHESEPLEAIALEAQEIREREREDLANRIRAEIGDLLNKSNL